MAALWENDLTERIGAMTAKELRQGMRRGSFVGSFLAIQVLAMVCISIEARAGEAMDVDDFAGLLNPYVLFVSGPFWVMAGAACGVLMPLGGLFLMPQELEEGNHELLQLTPVSRWRVVRGKFLSLWGLSAVALASMLPYSVSRYLLGGTSWWNETCCFLTVLALAAIVGAGCIGASAFKNWGARILVLGLFLAVAAANCGITAGAAAGVMGPWTLFHITAVVAVGATVAMGLALARSRLRLAVMAYETKPSSTVLGLVMVSPFAVGLGTLLTFGFAGFVVVGLLALAVMAADRTPGEKFLSRRPLVRRIAGSRAAEQSAPRVSGEETAREESP